MYEDLEYWMACANRFRYILDRLDITARTLYWCPNDLAEAEREMKEAEAKRETDIPSTPIQRTSSVKCFSHSNLFLLGDGEVAAASVNGTENQPVASTPQFQPQERLSTAASKRGVASFQGACASA